MNHTLILIAFVLLTHSDGGRLWLPVPADFTLSDPLHSPKGCRTEIKWHDTRYCVRETPEEVINKVKEADK